MIDSTVFWVLGASAGVNIFLFGLIKADTRDIWKRLNTHNHKIDCDSPGCKPKTCGVIINGE